MLLIGMILLVCFLFFGASEAHSRNDVETSSTLSILGLILFFVGIFLFFY